MAISSLLMACTLRPAPPRAGNAGPHQGATKQGCEIRSVVELLNAEGAPARGKRWHLRQAGLNEDELERFAAKAPPDGATAHAELVLKRIRDAMSTWPVRFDLPTWLDAPLLAYYIGRYGSTEGEEAAKPHVRRC